MAAKLSELLRAAVRFAPDCVGPEAEAIAREMDPGEVLLLENLRFHAEEEKNDPAFAGQLAALAEAYVDDAFGTAHRAHASVVGMPERLERKAAGRLLAREVEALGRLLGEPERPFAALLGGAKIEGKIDTLENLLPRLDLLLLGGGMANTFLAAQGHDLGASLFEPDRLDLARRDPGARPAPRGPRSSSRTDLVVDGDLDDPAASRPWPRTDIPRGTQGGGHRAADAQGLRRGASAAPAPCSGMAPWESSRSRPSTPAPARSPRPWLAARDSRSSAAARRWPRPTRRAWPSRSATSPPAAAPLWSSWRARRCPGVAVLEKGR